MSGAAHTPREILNLEAADALVRWRVCWEQHHVNPPTAAAGHGKELHMWELAGELMESRRITRKLPG